MKLVLCSTEQLKDSSGWHLICPDLYNVKFGIKNAKEKGHNTIYIHYERIGTANLSIPYDIIDFLIKLSNNNYHDDKNEYKIKFTHPCTPDNSLQSERDLK